MKLNEKRSESGREKTKGDIFCWRNNMKFCSGGMLAATRVKMSDSEKGVNMNTSDIPSIKRATRSFWKFQVTVVQNNGKEMHKKSVLHVQSCFFAN